jgi:hypothetical protein
MYRVDGRGSGFEAENIFSSNCIKTSRGAPKPLHYYRYPATSDMKLTIHLHLFPIIEHVDIYLHRRNLLIISVEIIVANFITLVKINFKESLQYSDFKTNHYVAGVEKKEPNKQRCKITRLFEFGVGPCPKENLSILTPYRSNKV